MGFISSLLGEDALTVGVTILALVVVLVPFIRGLKVTFQAFTATRILDAKGIETGLRQGSGGDIEPLSLLMVRVFRSSMTESEEHTPEFVFDASRQYVMNEFDVYYTRPITMFASLMPPIGFIGTTVGMLILFISMHKADTALELGALAIALTSSIFALMAYAVLESVKIRLYTRLVRSLRVCEAVCGSAPKPPAQAAGGRAAPTSRPAAAGA